MGWLCMSLTGMGAHTTPKSYLDNQLSWRSKEKPDTGNELIVSRIVGSVYYAAVAPIQDGVPGAPFAAVCLTKWNPGSKDGAVFGYKDMDESMGPCEANCPKAVLDALGPTDSASALQWRWRCYLNLAAGSQAKVEDGALIRFAVPIRFINGEEHQVFRVFKTGGAVSFGTRDDRRGRFKIRRFQSMPFERVHEPKAMAARL